MYNMERIDQLDLFESSSSSSESEHEVYIKQRNNLYEDLDEIDFKKRFRISKKTFQRLSDLLEDVMEPIDNRNQPLSKNNQILLYLRFYATGSFQINVGDHFNVSQPTVSRIVTNVTSHIAAIRPQFIYMPETDEEKRDTVLKFYHFAGLPGIIGALDCTHIKIQSPGGDNAEVYRNRKGYFSINTQVVGDSNLKIMDIVARWPGSVHDTTIFNDSNIRGKFENNEFSPYCLVGDGGYPCRIYLLTPLLDPQTLPQQRYNTAQIKTRNPVERLFGVWKRRFPCLSLGMRVKIETICEIIVATAVLHNICCEEKDTVDILDEIDDMQDNEIFPQRIVGHRNQNTSTRDSIIATVFVHNM